MTDSTARRVVLALMHSESFSYVADTTWQVSSGNPVQEDFGFAVEEIATTDRDRLRIAEEYGELKKTYSFWKSEMLARVRFLIGLEEATSDPTRWSPDWPVEPGNYWFYGHLSPEPRGPELKRLLYVNAWKSTAFGEMVYEVPCRFYLRPENTAEALWTRVIMPALPGEEG